MMPANTWTQRNNRLSHSLRVGSIVIENWCFYRWTLLTSPISGVDIGTDQQRHMIVLGRVVDLEDHRDLRIEALDTKRGKIGFSIEDQPIDSFAKRLLDQKERFDTSIRVGPGMT